MRKPEVIVPIAISILLFLTCILETSEAKGGFRGGGGGRGGSRGSGGRGSIRSSSGSKGGGGSWWSSWFSSKSHPKSGWSGGGHASHSSSVSGSKITTESDGKKYHGYDMTLSQLSTKSGWARPYTSSSVVSSKTICFPGLLTICFFTELFC